MSDSVHTVVHHPISAAARQTFQARIADHVNAIVTAARELQTAAAAGRDPAPEQEATVQVRMALQVRPAPSAVDTAPIVLPADPCDGTPIIVEYVCGHFLTGEPYYCHEILCY